MDLYRILIPAFCSVLWISQCSSQFEGLGMMAAMMGGGMGGMGGMGGFGGSRGLGMGMGMGAAGMSPAEYAVMEEAVHTIIGPHANPDPALIMFAEQQGGIPTNIFQMSAYIPLFQDMARRVGLQPPPTVVQTTFGNITQSVDDAVMQRAVRWMNHRGAMTSMMG